MMFLLIFGSLAAAMAIVSQGNLRTADSHLKINRSLASAETGMELMIFRLGQITQGDANGAAIVDMGDVNDPFSGVRTIDGLIHGGNSQDADGNVYDLWQNIVDKLVLATELDPHYNGATFTVDTTTYGADAFGRPIIALRIPAVQIGAGGSSFEVTMIPHPLPLSEQPSAAGYDDPAYDQAPYDGSDPDTGIDWDVSEAAPLDGRFIRVRVTGFDGIPGREVYRSISMDFRLDKTIPYAVLSRSRIMIGRNVSIRGNVGSQFSETDKLNGHPIQIQSDFLGLSDDLDEKISPPNSSYPGGGTFHNELVLNDINGDNRINIHNDSETVDWPGGQVGAALADIDDDGYVTDFDIFLKEFDDNGNGDKRVSRIEFVDEVDAINTDTAEQLFLIMDTAGDPGRAGYNDGFIDGDDLYSKIRGSVSLKATESDWNNGLTVWGDDGTGTPPTYEDYLFKDYMQGAIKPDHGKSALTTGDSALDVHVFDQHSFDTSEFATMATSVLAPGSGVARAGFSAEYEAPGATPLEEVPFGAAYPYDYYERPVHRNKVFTDLRIPKGTNPLFENCRFIGVTYIEIETANGDENFNYVGMQESDGTDKHPDFEVIVNGTTFDSTPDAQLQHGTKRLGNNVRFHDCTFEGPVVSGALDGSQPTQFTHVRNKVTFTGDTKFDFDAVPDDDDKALFERSSLLLPHVSVEMGSFLDGASSSEVLELSGAIVAGLIDMRGQIKISGTLITTFEPISGVSPVKGDTAPQFNTTLGYFSQGQGDLEAELPTTGLGNIRLVYDPTLALPDGIDGPIELKPLIGTYRESGR